MLFHNAPLFAAARSAKRNGTTAERGLDGFAPWFASEFGVRVVFVTRDEIQAGGDETRTRLIVIVETDEDRDRLCDRFRSVRPGVARACLARLAKVCPGVPVKAAFLVIDSFADECLVQACSKFLDHDATVIANEYRDRVWRIDGFARTLAVFFRTESDRTQSEVDGTTAAIRQRCFTAVCRYDEFDYLTEDDLRLRFESKETLDRKYDGKLFYYWK